VDGATAARVRRAYRRQAAAAGGTWRAHIAAIDPAGRLQVLVDDDADRVTPVYSVQKLAVAVAVMAKVDGGDLRLDHRVRLTGDVVLGGSGAYHLQPVWGDELTLAGVLTAMLLVSDNTAVRLCGLVAPAPEVNDILAAKGLRHTRVEQDERPERYFLGGGTARETHDLLWRLASRTLLAPASCDFLLAVLRAGSGYHDGIRRRMSSAERARVATKHGADADERGAGRHEAGVVFAVDGSPALTYALFADGLGDVDNYGATHPGVEAHAALGRVMLDALGPGG
jgi:beta-lactamase class A